jgi:hypothetical protein
MRQKSNSTPAIQRGRRRPMRSRLRREAQDLKEVVAEQALGSLPY